MFKIGEKVVCVNDGKLIDCIKLEKNQIYTIREINHYKTGTGVLLEEVVNKKQLYLEGILEAPYKIERFRKLDYDFAENLLAEITESVMQKQNQN